MYVACKACSFTCNIHLKIRQNRFANTSMSLKINRSPPPFTAVDAMRIYLSFASFGLYFPIEVQVKEHSTLFTSKKSFCLKNDLKKTVCRTLCVVPISSLVLSFLTSNFCKQASLILSIYKFYTLSY